MNLWPASGAIGGSFEMRSRARPGWLDSRFPLSEIGPMTVKLASDVADFLEAQVRAGVCSNANELANDLLRSVQEQQQKPFEISPELEQWLLSSADGPVTPLTSGDFAAIRRRVRARMQSTGT